MNDMVIAQKLHDLTNTSSQIVGAVSALELEAAKAEDTLDRVSVTDDDSCGRAMELVRSITQVVNTADTSRKSFTNPIKGVADYIKALFDAPIDRLSDVSKQVKAKVDVYVVAENKRKRERAAQDAREAEERALAAAAAAEKAGDTAGADSILTQASAVITSPEVAKVKSTTVFGSTVYSKTNVIASITDKKLFLQWVLDEKNASFLDQVDIQKSLVNKIAAASVDKDKQTVTKAVPGLSITFSETGAIA